MKQKRLWDDVEEKKATFTFIQWKNKALEMLEKSKTEYEAIKIGQQSTATPYKTFIIVDSIS